MRPFKLLGVLALSASATTVIAQGGTAKQLDSQVARLRASGDTALPDADHFTLGDRTIAAGTSVEGPIAVARGNLDVFGTVRGGVYAIDGEIRIHRGARVTGDAFAAGGRVVVDGGVIEGERRSITSPVGASAPAPATRPLDTWQTVKLVLGWFTVLTIIGIGVMVFAEGNLDGVVVALERGIARSFWIGVFGQLVALPVLVVLILALAITVLGILLIPFAIVSYVIAAAGLVTLGLLAVARLTGTGLTSPAAATSERGVNLRALITGLVLYMSLWLLAAAFTWNPVAGAILRGIAIAVTWVAATVGLGATVVSRAGTQRPGVRGSVRRTASDELSWQTPTPVSGVAAARRPVSSAAKQA
jgi:hypothetical protein